MTPQPSCAGTGSPKGNLTALKACCVKTAGCVGFNTDSVIKASGCGDAVQGGEPCDLFLLKDSPQPPPAPPPPPYPAPPSQRLSVGLWPLPRNVTSGGTTLALAPAFFFTAVGNTTPTVQTIVNRYSRLVLLHGLPTTSPADANTQRTPLLQSCTVQVVEDTETLTRGMDESYELQVGADGGSDCNITANTFVGLQYGLETFSQLVRAAVAGGTLVGRPGTPSTFARLMISCTARFSATARLVAA